LSAAVDDRRTELLRAAADEVARLGVDRVRLRDVARAAGVSIGLLQHYFETRDGLVREAFELAALDHLRRHMARVTDDPWERLCAILDDVVLAADAEREAVSWVDLCASAIRHAELRPTVARVQEGWRELLQTALEDGVAAGCFDPPLDPGTAATAINALIDGFELSLAAGALELGDRGAARELLLRSAAVLAGHRAGTLAA
jgi:AcrR family transcriptional regulator